MRENRPYGLEGGEPVYPASLPLSHVDEREPRSAKKTKPVAGACSIILVENQGSECSKHDETWQALLATHHAHALLWECHTLRA